MLCTNSTQLLYSVEGKMALNFRPATNPPIYNPIQKNLIVTWDVFMQNYRTINMDSCSLVTLIPATDIFWKYFTEKISTMTSGQKIRFMDI